MTVAEQQEQGLRAYPPAQGLYNSVNEHDACGVGMVADLNNRPSHRIVEQGLTVLRRLTHRGAAGWDPETGDGAGILTALPDGFFRARVANLPERGAYGVAMLFGGVGLEQGLEAILREEGLKPFAWREVPTHPEAIGRSARESCPKIRQLFVRQARGQAPLAADAFERKLYVARRRLEKAFGERLYVCSFSARSIVYKGLLLAHQLDAFYEDLQAEDFASALVLAHQRYSTNTFPTWSLAQPFRFLAHNGEINTLRGNLNALHAREGEFESPLFGGDIKKLIPLVPPGQSDSACLDNMLELLVQAGRDLPHAMLMLMPQAWGPTHHMGNDVRGFLEYHSALMEPWDGPAAVAFSDGIRAGAVLDRNGLRPARYTLCKDGTFVLASETGVLDIPPEAVERHGRLRPGEMLWLDLEAHRLLRDAEIKSHVARRRPYRRWVEENRILVDGLFRETAPEQIPGDLLARQARFGYSREDIATLLKPMAANGQEPVGSMGNDAALAVLSEKPRLLFDYFKQRFAQVTNPPIDPIREVSVMSLMTYVGNKANILAETPEHARLIKMRRPVLTDAELEHLGQVGAAEFRPVTLKMAFPQGGDGTALAQALVNLAAEAAGVAAKGHRLVILSDRDLAPGEVPIPSLLAVATVNRALTEAGVRSETGLVVQSGEVREVMHFALLLGYGATAIHPYLALATVADLSAKGLTGNDPVSATANYIRAVDKGILKVMSKMGISTLRSYRSSQIFEAVGLGRKLIDEFLPGTVSRVGGIGLDELAADANRRAATTPAPLPAALPLAAVQTAALPAGGEHTYRVGGERHLWTPQAIADFRQAVREGDYESFKRYSQAIDNQAHHLCTLRGLFGFTPTTPIPLDEVESEEAIVRHFVSGAMSLGSLSPEAHETIAKAMNTLGAMSNSGEGGENAERFGTDLGSAIKQIASGRFGVTADYLRHARDLQIKMAQGAKPGEGGQLPGHKVDAFVAKIRHALPGLTLISPPPHHDIYSIEDLAQLIYDLRTVNPEARVSVKLVSEVGVGTVAAGVAKAHADVILIAGHDGGTGASPLSSIHHAGLPWELGLAETQQTLVLNRLRGRVRIQVDGQIKTGRDVVIGALLGAQEFGFATTILVCLGCVMMRQCHSNTCPAGVATQDPELRKRFAGKPEYIVNFLRFVAREVREHLAALGLRSLDEAVGRTDLLRFDEAIAYAKTRQLDFSAIFAHVTPPGPEPTEAKEPAGVYDRTVLLPAIAAALAGRRAADSGQPTADSARSATDQPAAQKLSQPEVASADGPCANAPAAVSCQLSAVGSAPIELTLDVRNTDRSIGTGLAGEIAARTGEAGLSEGSILLHLKGVAGQSLGAFLTSGVTLDLEGEANDYVGKGLSGGTVIVRPKPVEGFIPEENVAAGNVIGYGATSGRVFINGLVGERFAIRNSGATLVCEGTGDHGCEYMTGGRVLVLGPAGDNFAAGMTGGLAYVLDEAGDFDLRCNLGSVDLESVDPGTPQAEELRALLAAHVEATGSPKGRRILEDFAGWLPRFVLVFPVEYRRALERAAEQH